MSNGSRHREVRALMDAALAKGVRTEEEFLESLSRQGVSSGEVNDAIADLDEDVALRKAFLAAWDELQDLLRPYRLDPGEGIQEVLVRLPPSRAASATQLMVTAGRLAMTTGQAIAPDEVASLLEAGVLTEWPRG